MVTTPALDTQMALAAALHSSPQCQESAAVCPSHLPEALRVLAALSEIHWTLVPTREGVRVWTWPTFAAARLTRNGDCLEFAGSRSRDGYGQAWSGGKWWQTHRLAWSLVNGDIPAGLIVRHKCDNPPCCNPDHLVLGTHQDNANDRRERFVATIR